MRLEWGFLARNWFLLSFSHLNPKYADIGTFSFEARNWVFVGISYLSSKSVYFGTVSFRPYFWRILRPSHINQKCFGAVNFEQILIFIFRHSSTENRQSVQQRAHIFQCLIRDTLKNSDDFVKNAKLYNHQKSDNRGGTA